MKFTVTVRVAAMVIMHGMVLVVTVTVTVKLTVKRNCCGIGPWKFAQRCVFDTGRQLLKGTHDRLLAG